MSQALVVTAGAAAIPYHRVAASAGETASVASTPPRKSAVPRRTVLRQRVHEVSFMCRISQNVGADSNTEARGDVRDLDAHSIRREPAVWEPMRVMRRARLPRTVMRRGIAIAGPSRVQHGLVRSSACTAAVAGNCAALACITPWAGHNDRTPSPGRAVSNSSGTSESLVREGASHHVNALFITDPIVPCVGRASRNAIVR